MFPHTYWTSFYQPPQCDSFVAKYAPEIVQLLVNELDPDQVCTKLGLCSSSVRLASPNVELSAKVVVDTMEQLLIATKV